MNIVYQGSFLREGPQQLGHRVFPVSFARDRTLDEQVDAACADPDFVLIELWGDTNLPTGLSESRHRLVAHCIDSPLNEYWISELGKVFDDLFVDQLSSVAALAREGLRAVWLPVCVSESAFRQPARKEHDIAFVGRFSPERVKRLNIVTALRRRYPVCVTEGVSAAGMADIFARSRIVLNENLFSGLTLRVLQGMASGSPVLTEANAAGVDDFFRDGIHLVAYTPSTLLEKAGQLLADDDASQAIASAGQEACRAGHTSRRRAEELLAALAANAARNARRDQPVRRLAEARALARLCQRYGGLLSPARRTARNLLQDGGNVAGEAACLLGDMEAWRGRAEEAIRLYFLALRQGHVFPAALKLALLFLQAGDTRRARRLLDTGRPALAENVETAGNEADSSPEALLLHMAETCFARGRVFYPGWLKPLGDPVPETALEVALMAWKRGPSARILDMLLRCADACALEGQMLPYLLEAVRRGFATDAHIVRTAQAAERLYNQDLARSVLDAFRKQGRARRQQALAERLFRQSDPAHGQRAGQEKTP